ncbi:hypothetical protein ACTFIW_008757 [Dictyostelium discoideum]
MGKVQDLLLDDAIEQVLSNRYSMYVLLTTHSLAFYPGEDELIQFEEGFYKIDLPNLEISNLVSYDANTSSSPSSSHVPLSSGNIPRSIEQTIRGSNTAELLIKSWNLPLLRFIAPVIFQTLYFELFKSSKQIIISFTVEVDQVCVIERKEYYYKVYLFHLQFYRCSSPVHCGLVGAIETIYLMRVPLSIMVFKVGSTPF